MPNGPSVQCAHVFGDDQPTKRGKQCGRMCKFGFAYCNFHGGSTAPAKAQAEKMIALARMPAIEALYNIVEQFNEQTCGTCGYPNGEKETQTPVIRAAQVILDRTGMGPASVLEVKQNDGEKMDLSLLTSEERGELLALMAQMKDLKARIKLRIQHGPSVAHSASEPPARIM